MNSWNHVLQLLGWFVYAILFLLAILVAWGIIKYVIERIIIFRSRRRRPFVAKASFKQDDYMSEATVYGMSQYYGADPTDRGVTHVADKAKLEAFRDGARWAWNYFNRP